MTVLSGDFENFHRHYAPFVTSYVGRRITDNDVDDVVANVFATAWRRHEELPEDALPWLYRTARNLIGNQYRSSARWAALQSKLRSVPSEPHVDPAELAHERAGLISAMRSLEEDDRELLLLVAWEGLATAEIAVAMEISPGAASVRLHRARQRLEKAMRQATADSALDAPQHEEN